MIVFKYLIIYHYISNSLNLNSILYNTVTCVGVGGVHAVAVAAVGAARHVPRLPAAAAPQPPRLLVLLVQLVDVILLHLTTSEISIFPHCLL